MGIILMVCGAYWIANALLLNTKNWQSAMLFKVIPFFYWSCNYRMCNGFVWLGKHF